MRFANDYIHFLFMTFFGIELVCFQFTNAVWRHQSELIN